jgi:hypothetical protein
MAMSEEITLNALKQSPAYHIGSVATFRSGLNISITNADQKVQIRSKLDCDKDKKLVVYDLNKESADPVMLSTRLEHAFCMAAKGTKIALKMRSATGVNRVVVLVPARTNKATYLIPSESGDIQLRRLTTTDTENQTPEVDIAPEGALNADSVRLAFDRARSERRIIVKMVIKGTPARYAVLEKRKTPPPRRRSNPPKRASSSSQPS